MVHFQEFGGGDRAGYGISMGLEYFSKIFLINICKGRVTLEGANVFWKILYLLCGSVSVSSLRLRESGLK